MGRRKESLDKLMACYHEADDRGEKSRWANQIGHAYKDKGEYVKALNWFKKDFELSERNASPAELMATCQCIGEMFLRLRNYENALQYQEKHHKYAKDAGDKVEQQRAATQLGCTYMDLYENCNSSFDALKNCKSFLKTSMDLAKELKKNPPRRDSPSFVRELVDAYNNMGLLKLVTDDSSRAEEYFLEALNICDEEELGENDEARSRVHHNLGRVYCERREWKKAKEHMQRDIKICGCIGNKQGEAKGLINLGQLTFKQLQFEDAQRSFKRALDIAKSLTDEDSLMDTAKSNLKTVEEAKRHLLEFEGMEQKLKKVQRTPGEGTEEYRLLTEILAEAQNLGDWEKYRYYSKRQKKVAQQLGDADQLAESYAAVATGYYNLRNFEKAKKWTLKNVEICKRAKIYVGQVSALIDYGNALDSTGDFDGAFRAYKDAYGLAKSRNLVEQKVSALENMHYMHTIRFQDVHKAKEASSKLERLKRVMEDGQNSPEKLCSDSDDEKRSGDAVASHEETEYESADRNSSHREVPRPKRRKRQRVVVLDDEDEEVPSKLVEEPVIELSSHSRSAGERNPAERIADFQQGESSSTDMHARPMEVDALPHLPPLTIPTNVGGFTIRLELNQSEPISFRCFMEKLVQQYKYEKPEGPHPVLKGLLLTGEEITHGTNICGKLAKNKGNVEAMIVGWRDVPFVELYKLHCLKCNADPIPGLVKKLELAKEGEIDVRDCDLDKVSAWPLLLAIGDSNDIVSNISLAHNRLESSTVNELVRKLSATRNGDIGLALDFHGNKLGATALLELCQCKVTLSRLEVLVLSRNELTDRIAHNLGCAIEQAQRLQILELEECGLTTPSFEGLKEALKQQSRLRRLAIGKNHPIGGHALKLLFERLSTLSSFTDLDISDIQVNCAAVEGLVHLIKTSSTFSVLVMKQNPIGAEMWQLLSKAISDKSSQFVRIDLTECRIAPAIGHIVYRHLMDSPALIDLSLAGNMLDDQAIGLLSQKLTQPTCQLKKLDLSYCWIPQTGVVKILESLEGNYFLVDIRLAGNSCGDYRSSNDVVADSEDEENDGSELVQALAKALSSAGTLQNVDLSDNSMEKAADLLFKAWSQRRRRPRKHVEDNGVFHLSIEGFSCCSTRSCCNDA